MYLYHLNGIEQKAERRSMAEQQKEFVLELDTAHYLREVEESDDDILYPDGRYYRKDKENFALHKNNRIYE